MRLGTAKKSRIQASFCEVHNPEMNKRPTAGFSAGIGNDAVIPVNVLRVQVGDVRL